MRGKNRGETDSDDIPLYLAIVFKDPKTAVMQLLQEGVSSIMTKYGQETRNLLSSCESLLRLAKTGKATNDGWRLPANWHLTCAFLGRDEDKADLSQVYQSFKEKVKMDVHIQAFVVVPDKIVTAICFPDQAIQPIENACPHVTLAFNEWHPKDSNSLLEKTCLKESMAFFSTY